MKELNFLNEFYKSRSSDENSSYLLNMYLEQDTSGGKSNTAGFPYPGCTLTGTVIGSVNVRGAISVAGIPYFVIGNQFYSMASNGTLTSLGTLYTSTGQVTLAAITNEIMLIDGIYGYSYLVVSNTFQVIANKATTLQSTASAGASSITPFTTANMTVGDNLIITLDSGSQYNTSITSISGGAVGFSGTLSSQASLGNLVVDTPLPFKPIALISQDEFFLTAGANTNIVRCSASGDIATWPPLSFQGAGGSGDNIVGLATNKRYVYVICQQHIEIWYNNGVSPMPFTSVGPGSYFYIGGAATNSIAITGSTTRKERGVTDPGQAFIDQEAIVLLAQSANGGLSVVTVDQYKPVQIANRAISLAINSLSTYSDAIGYCCEFLSHAFYILTFPTANVTYAFDFTSGIWFQLQSYVNGSYQRHLGNCYCCAYGQHYLGDWNSGSIYKLDFTDYQDNGQQIIRQIVTPPGFFKGNKGFLDKLQVTLQNNVGSNLAVTLEISYDSGQTFTTVGTQNIPAAGGRMYWTRLGMTQDAIVLRLTFTANAFFAVLGALANIRQGIH